jgi:hypothetical protein
VSRPRGFYDINGHPLEVVEWAILREDSSYSTMAETQVTMPDGVTAWVKTVWLGYVDDFIDGAKMFGTAVGLGDGSLMEVAVYDTREQALDGHAHQVVALRGGTRPRRYHNTRKRG